MDSRTKIVNRLKTLQDIDGVKVTVNDEKKIILVNFHTERFLDFKFVRSDDHFIGYFTDSEGNESHAAIAIWDERELLLAEGAVGRAALDLRLDLDCLIRRANLLAGSFAVAAESLASHNDRLSRTPSIMPTAGYLSSRFANSRLHPIFHEERPHPGIDISAPMGTPILAAAGGTVIDVSMGNGYGRMVTVDHGYGLVTRYAHLQKALVRTGQRVHRGDQIAPVGIRASPPPRTCTTKSS